MRKLYLLNSHLAHMPELEAYPRALSDEFNVVRVDDYEGSYQDGIFWCFMGLYRRRNNASFLIHDYRSLSTGLAPSLKDYIKKKMNPRPDLRIFLNEAVEEVMNFRDGVPSFLLDMGVPEKLLNTRPERRDAFRYRFGYIGEISKDRGLDRMLKAFSRSAYKEDSFILIGRAEASILSEFEGMENLHFAGVMPQEKVFETLQQVEFAVSVLPNKRPYCYQTATKLLEYAALGMKILANRNPSMMRTSDQYGIRIKWMGDWIFDSLGEIEGAKDNMQFDVSDLSWSKMMENSGLLKHLREIDIP